MKNPLSKIVAGILLISFLPFIANYFESLANDIDRMSTEYAASMYGLGLILLAVWFATVVVYFKWVARGISVRAPRTEPALPAWVKGAALLSLLASLASAAFWFLAYDFLTTKATADEATFLYIFGTTISALSMASALGVFSAIMRNRR